MVCGVGSGAAITGIGEALKRKKHSVQVVAVEAEETKQAAVTGKNRAEHGIFGIVHRHCVRHRSVDGPLHIRTIFRTVFAVLIVSFGPTAALAVFGHQLVF